jgi:hypothetical protein
MKKSRAVHGMAEHTAPSVLAIRPNAEGVMPEIGRERINCSNARA